MKLSILTFAVGLMFTAGIRGYLRMQITTLERQDEHDHIQAICRRVVKDQNNGDPTYSKLNIIQRDPGGHMIREMVSQAQLKKCIPAAVLECWGDDEEPHQRWEQIANVFRDYERMVMGRHDYEKMYLVYIWGSNPGSPGPHPQQSWKIRPNTVWRAYDTMTQLPPCKWWTNPTNCRLPSCKWWTNPTDVE